MATIELAPIHLPDLLHISSCAENKNESTLQISYDDRKANSLDSLAPFASRPAAIATLASSDEIVVHNDSPVPVSRTLSRLRASFVITSLTGITILNCFGQSILIVAIPRIATELKIPSTQIQWPAAAASLTLGCTLLVVGAVADVIGARPIFLTGTLLHLAFGIGSAVARSGPELIAFRALQGVALSFCMPTSVSIICKNFKAGRGRNIAFACFGGGNPLGYAVGLLLEGIFVDTVGWRAGFYLALALNALVLLIASFALPQDIDLGADSAGLASSTDRRQLLHRLSSKIDWIGLGIISTAIALMSYALGSITAKLSISSIQPVDIALVVLAGLLFPGFALWVGRQERLGKVTLIPNSIWANAGFTSVCVATFLTWAMFNAVTFNTTLLLQQIEGVSALQTSLRFLPVVLMGIIMNILAGYLVDKVTARTLLLVASVLSAVSPVLLATLSPANSYWIGMFPAMCLLASSSDFLFSISNLVITSTFATTDQALAGGVFNTVAQLGNSIGLAVTSAISASVSAKAQTHKAAGLDADDMLKDSMLQGYRAAFWTCFAAAIVSCVVGTIGLRRAGKVGLKRE